jgi:hypothetical protein
LPVGRGTVAQIPNSRKMSFTDLHREPPVIGSANE